MYSGEMDIESMGFRFDTWNGNFSNFGARTGSSDLGEGKTVKGYEMYLKDLSTKSGFVVVTPKDLNGRKANICDIQKLIKIHKPDLVILDQMSLLDDYRKGNFTTTQRYENISTDLLTMVKSINIPVILVAQAKRAEKKKDNEKENPELDGIMSSDKIGQDSTKVITLLESDGILTLKVVKARGSAKDFDVKMKWNIDKGILEPLLNDEEVEDVSNREDSYGF